MMVIIFILKARKQLQRGTWASLGSGAWGGVARGRFCSLVELQFGLLGSFQPSSQGSQNT